MERKRFFDVMPRETGDDFLTNNIHPTGMQMPNANVVKTAYVRKYPIPPSAVLPTMKVAVYSPATTSIQENATISRSDVGLQRKVNTSLTMKRVVFCVFVL